MVAYTLTDDPQRRLPPWALWLAIGVVLALLLWGLSKFVLSGDTSKPARKITQVTVLRPPPPPPPPKPQEKPPEPPKVKEEVKLEQPRPVNEPKAEAPKEAPPPGPLGVDAAGNGPGDGFGLAGRPGGRDITTIGGGGGGGLSQNLFGSAVARHLAQELARSASLRGIEYRVDLRVWIAGDGHIERVELIRGSGDPELDALIRDGLTRVSALRQAVPEGIPQPVRIRVTSSDA